MVAPSGAPNRFLSICDLSEIFRTVACQHPGHVYSHTSTHTHGCVHIPQITLLELSEFVNGGFDLTPVVSLCGKVGNCLAWPQLLIPHSVEGKPAKLFGDSMRKNPRRTGSILTSSDSWSWCMAGGKVVPNIFKAQSGFITMFLIFFSIC